MIKLIVPQEEYLRSYREAFSEYVDNGVSAYSFTDASSCDFLRNLPVTERSAACRLIG